MTTIFYFLLGLHGAMSRVGAIDAAPARTLSRRPRVRRAAAPDTSSGRRLDRYGTYS
jgi:hypothetical protein